METTVSSYAFDSAKAKNDANVVNRLQAAGLIVFAKDNMGVSVVPRFSVVTLIMVGTRRL